MTIQQMILVGVKLDRPDNETMVEGETEVVGAA